MTPSYSPPPPPGRSPAGSPRHAPRDGKREGSKRRTPRAISDLIGPTLRDMGVPSQRVTEKLREAWALAADPDWKGEVTLQGIRGGVLEVGVRSAALRNELACFHRDRVLSVMRTALPDIPLVAIRFAPSTADGAGR